MRALLSYHTPQEVAYVKREIDTGHVALALKLTSEWRQDGNRESIVGFLWHGGDTAERCGQGWRRRRTFEECGGGNLDDVVGFLWHSGGTAGGRGRGFLRRSVFGGSEGGYRDCVVGFVRYGGGAQEEEVEEGALVNVVETGFIAMNEGELGA